MGNTQVWDTRGNLLAYRGVSYGYDGENRLAAVAMGSGAVTTAYDPAGRLRQIGAAVTSQFVYDGDMPIAEYNASGGAIINRFVPGASVDETIVAYDAGGTRNWYHADAQGSVAAASDGSGNAVVINQYGPNGEPGLVYQGRNAGRIRYTGQIYVPELAPYGGPSQPLYSFKARLYAPKLGRFLQTDPIGAIDDNNLYAYVGNDPINFGDPSGLVADLFKGKPQSGKKAPCSSNGSLAGKIADWAGTVSNVSSGVAVVSGGAALITSETVVGGIGFGAIAGGAEIVSLGASGVQAGAQYLDRNYGGLRQTLSGVAFSLGANAAFGRILAGAAGNITKAESSQYKYMVGVQNEAGSQILQNVCQ